MADPNQQLGQTIRHSTLSRWGWFCCCYFIVQLALICPMACIIHELSFSNSAHLQANPSAVLFVCRLETPPASSPTADHMLSTAIHRHQLVALFAMVLIGLNLLLHVKPQTQRIYHQRLRLASFDVLPKLPPPRSA
ncbi:hypothetical protein [Herpetosiphon gulosus]|uniref:Uncharacterized protein n=1 Tax=Herpetosiphon gulosus TaxID=1973496 RepID=A0ABP9X058_9CHLR